MLLGFQFTLGPNPLCHPFGGETVITARFLDISVKGNFTSNLPAVACDLRGDFDGLLVAADGGSYGISASANGPFPPGGQLHVKGLRVSNTLSSGLLIEE